jgi:ATP-dependent helicase/nuclease subunit A
MIITEEKKKRTFSDEQELAITTKDRTLLVSAAAGSGKTTTLTERIIRSLLDKENPESIQNMLIVTFTNASVFDLKEKIGRALLDAVKENPDNKRLCDELHSLGHAKIMTIDSFCAELVRANAERLGISPSYRIAEGAETLLLERSTLTALIDAAFEGELMPRVTPDDFELLCDALTGVKNTPSLTDKLIVLFEKTKSSTRGIDIFTDFANNYLQYSELELEKTPYGEYLINMAKETLSHFVSERERYILPLLTSDDDKIRALGIDIEDIVTRLAAALSVSDSYDSLYSFFASFDLPKAPPVPNPKPPEVVRATKYRQAIKDAVGELGAPFFSYSRQEWRELYRNLSKCIGTLSSFLSIFSETYFEEKRRTEEI